MPECKVSSLLWEYSLDQIFAEVILRECRLLDWSDCPLTLKEHFIFLANEKMVTNPRLLICCDGKERAVHCKLWCGNCRVGATHTITQLQNINWQNGKKLSPKYEYHFNLRYFNWRYYLSCFILFSTKCILVISINPWTRGQRELRIFMTVLIYEILI